jgi:ATP-binding cassette subfamily B protein
MAVLSFLGGSVEAGFLILVTRTALVIADGADSFTAPIVGEVFVRTSIVVGLVLLVVRLGLSLGTVRVSAGLVVKASNSFRSVLADAFLHTSWSIQQGEPAGRLQQLVTDFSERASDIIVSFTATVGTSLNLLALLLIALVVNPVATLAVIVVLLLLGLVLAPIRRAIQRRSGAAALSQMDFARSIAELSALGQEMQAFGVRDQFGDRVRQLVARWSLQRTRVLELSSSVLPIYTTLAYGAVVLGLGAAVLSRPTDLTGIGAVMLLMLRSLTYGQQLQTASANLFSAMPFLDELDATIAHFRSDPAPHGEAVPGDLSRLVARGLGFSYVEGRQVLHDLSFVIEPGEVVGVIGPSGAGKSTLIELLLGLREPTEGSVEFGGFDLRSIDRNEWSHRVGFVAQEARLITGTVSENIRFFRDGLSIDAVRSAAARAHLAGDIDGLPEGFDTHLGERGVRLSGGQRQRLSIARALAGAPELLILDEPTSALDVRSEGLIREAVTSLRGEMTVVVIAHRMSTLDACDRIMVIEDGEMVAFDSPESLLATSDFYREALRLSGIL